jgi:signal transduction histidine kinase
LNYSDVVSRAAEYCHHLAENWRQTTRQTTDFVELDAVVLARQVKEVIFFNNAAIQLSGLAQAPVRGSNFELTRVCQNLFKNALEAGSSVVKVHFEKVGDQIELTVTDNGAGMDAETARRALKGGFTTKSTGTGLGLGICRHVLGAHGASLAVESEPARGTIIRILFPPAQIAISQPTRT